MQHKGEIVQKAVRESGYPITKLAQKMKRSRRWVYLAFENSNLSLDYILAIGKIIHHDFSGEIRELKNYLIVSHESRPTYAEHPDNSEYWKDKYLNLLEDYNALLLKLGEKEK